MRISDQRIIHLQKLLKRDYDIDMSVEDAQQAGLAIVRFVYAKLRQSAMPLKEKKYERSNEKLVERALHQSNGN